MEEEEPENPESDAWQAAYDLLVDAGVNSDKAASLALTAGLNGRDPVAWTRKYLRLRRAAQSP
jgi:hypothetical protein